MMGEEALVEEVRELIRTYLEKKDYRVLSSPPKKYEAAGKKSVRMYIDVTKRTRES